jgi:hypothetical protein
MPEYRDPILIPAERALFSSTDRDSWRFGKSYFTVCRRTCYVEFYVNFYSRVTEPVDELRRFRKKPEIIDLVRATRKKNHRPVTRYR